MKWCTANKSNQEWTWHIPKKHLKHHPNHHQVSSNDSLFCVHSPFFRPSHDTVSTIITINGAPFRMEGKRSYRHHHMRSFLSLPHAYSDQSAHHTELRFYCWSRGLFSSSPQTLLSPTHVGWYINMWLVLFSLIHPLPAKPFVDIRHSYPLNTASSTSFSPSGKVENSKSSESVSCHSFDWHLAEHINPTSYNW